MLSFDISSLQERRTVMNRIFPVLIMILFCVNSTHSESLYAFVYPDSVIIVNGGVYTNCGSRFVFDVFQSADTITIIEQDTSSQLATCMCTYTLSTRLSGLSSGHYWVIVYRKPYTLLPIDTMYYVGATEFTIGSLIPPFASQSFQSACTGWGPGEVEEVEVLLPGRFTLYQNYPNPFNPSTAIKYRLPSTGFTTLKVYDLLGREITTLVEGEMSAGDHSTVWNAASVSSGIYFYRLQAGGHSAARRLILLR